MENKTKLTIDDYSKWRSNLEPYPQGENIPSTEELIELHKRLMEEASKIPASIFENIDPNSTGFGGKFNMGNNPCEHCPNNPKNNPHSSGFCNCALPALMNPMF
jgi:hypothetical protein